MRKLLNRRIVLTGASRGIGRALAQQLAKKGANLVLVARSQEALQQLESELSGQGADVLAVVADVSSEADRARALELATQRFGGVDILINNAGIGSWGHFSNSTEDILRQIMEVNFFAPAELIRSAIPLLQKGIQPAIVNVSSMCGRVGVPAWPEYSASKHALCGLTEALRGEMARFDIDVLLIVPGLASSTLSKNLLRNDGKMKIDFESGMPVEKVAQKIVRSIEKNRTETTIGSDARQMILVHRFFPWLVDRIMGKRVRKLYAS